MTTGDAAPLGTPCWIDLMTSDPDRSRAFYGEILGWTSEVAGEATGNPEEFGGYINFSKDGALVAGCMKNDPTWESPDAWSVYLAVADAEATVEAATASGGQVYAGATSIATLGTMAMIADVGGASIGMWQPGDHKGFGVLNEPGAPSWFELFTRDYEATIAFYEKVFGWSTRTEGDTPEFRYTTLVIGEEQVAGIMDAGAFLPEGVPAHWSIYFEVEDVDKTLAQSNDLGGSTVAAAEDTPYGRLATALDPTGTQFKLRGVS